MHFFDTINAQFVCLTCSAHYHCVSMYHSTGTLEEKEFRRDTSIAMPTLFRDVRTLTSW